MSVISMKQLLEAGVHFGHQTRRWNPKMAPYIYTERNGIYIIDLQQSVGMVDDAYNAIADTVANGGNILFVGTKKQAQDAIKTEAERCGQFYVNERWLGGMLTNCKTIQSRIGRLKMCIRDRQQSNLDAGTAAVAGICIGRGNPGGALCQNPFKKVSPKRRGIQRFGKSVISDREKGRIETASG